MISQSEVREAFDYDYSTGKLTSKHGYITSNTPKGYLRIRFNGKSFLVHRLIWVHVHGYVPTQLDHIDGCKTNNRVENLRECTNSEQHANKSRYKNNTSGFKGVFWCTNTKRWRAKIMKDRKDIHLGRFDSKEQAAKAYNDAAQTYFGQFAKLNIIPCHS